MRAPTVGLALLVGFLVVLLPAGSPARAEDFGAVGKVNQLLTVLESPQLAPGESGSFQFRLRSAYTEPVFNATLTAGIYEYATIEESVPVDAGWPFPYPRILESGGRELAWSFPTIDSGDSLLLSFTILTAADSRDMPHGSVFSQATYFLRFRLEFDGNASVGLQRFVMASRGHFTNAQWTAATNATNTTPCTPPWCRGNVNLTILGVDGVIPDSSFGVKEPIPQWPFYALVAAAVGFLALAFLYWVEENPGAYPRVEAWWARTRGRLARFRRARRGAPPSE